MKHFGKSAWLTAFFFVPLFLSAEPARIPKELITGNPFEELPVIVQYRVVPANATWGVRARGRRAERSLDMIRVASGQLTHGEIQELANPEGPRLAGY